MAEDRIVHRNDNIFSITDDILMELYGRTDGRTDNAKPISLRLRREIAIR